MRTRTFALTLSLSFLALAGCKSARPDDAYQARYTTTPPPGAVILPPAQPSAAPPVIGQPPSRLP